MQDASDRLLIPEKVHGREREVDALLASFDRVLTTGGTPEFVLVSGYSGWQILRGERIAQGASSGTGCSCSRCC
jgi:hypothetical protein